MTERGSTNRKLTERGLTERAVCFKKETLENEHLLCNYSTKKIGSLTLDESILKRDV